MKNNLSLLIVDDDEDLLQQFQFLLEDDFETIHLASSRQEALTFPLAEIDIFLIDVRLSEDPSNTDGLILAKDIRARNNSAIVIMMSRFEEEKFRKLAKEEAGADDFIRKPFDMDAFVQIVQKIKERRC